MFTFDSTSQEFASKAEFYAHLRTTARALLHDENDMIANMANLSSLLWHSLADINWVGFYITRMKTHSPEASPELVLGPFHGKPACVRIAFGRGVCGTTAQNKTTSLVKNVHEFPGHIACDSASNSEIVIPIFHNEEVIAVLDIDSPTLARFDEEDKLGLEALVEDFTKLTDFFAHSATLAMNTEAS